MYPKRFVKQVKIEFRRTTKHKRNSKTKPKGLINLLYHSSVGKAKALLQKCLFILDNFINL